MPHPRSILQLAEGHGQLQRGVVQHGQAARHVVDVRQVVSGRRHVPFTYFVAHVQLRSQN